MSCFLQISHFQLSPLSTPSPSAKARPLIASRYRSQSLIICEGKSETDGQSLWRVIRARAHVHERTYCNCCDTGMSCLCTVVMSKPNVDVSVHAGLKLMQTMNSLYTECDQTCTNAVISSFMGMMHVSNCVGLCSSC